MSDSYVYFALKGDDFDPEIVTKRLDLTPSEIKRKGDRMGYSENKLNFSAWYLYAEQVDNLFVHKLVEEVVAKLFSKMDLINTLKAEFNLSSILEMVLYIDENEKVSTPVISQDIKTIEFLYKTNTETDFDIYKFNSDE